MNRDFYLFGYGSLVKFMHESRTNINFREKKYCMLQGYRRFWNVAMDNRINVDEYKYYIDLKTGKRIDAYVAFVNIERKRGCFVNGLLLNIPYKYLDIFNKRERNYEIINVSDNIFPRISDGEVWTYIAKQSSIDNYEKGLKEDKVVINKAYHDLIIKSFAKIGDYELSVFHETTEKPNVPLVPLKRIDIKT